MVIKSADTDLNMPANDFSTIFHASSRMKLKFDKGLPTPLKLGNSIYDLPNRFENTSKNRLILRNLKIPFKNVTEFERQVS
jgi:hypothetical protein